MNCDVRNSTLFREIDQRIEVLVRCMYAAVTDQPHQVERPAVAFDFVAGFNERRSVEEARILDRRIDANKVLHDHATGAEIQMTYFAVSHLSFRQTDGEPRRVQKRSRCSTPETIPRRSIRERDRVACAFFAIAPSVENNEN